MKDELTERLKAKFVQDINMWFENAGDGREPGEDHPVVELFLDYISEAYQEGKDDAMNDHNCSENVIYP